MGAAPSLPVLTLEIVLHDFGGVFGLVVLLQNTFRDNKQSFIFLKAFFVYSSFSPHLPKTFAHICYVKLIFYSAISQRSYVRFLCRSEQKMC